MAKYILGQNVKYRVQETDDLGGPYVIAATIVAIKEYVRTFHEEKEEIRYKLSDGGWVLESKLYE